MDRRREQIKEIIKQIGLLESKLEFNPHLESEINKKVRALGKQLEALEKKDSIEWVPFNKEQLENLYENHTELEISKMCGVELKTVNSHMRKWGIEKKNKKPRKSIKNKKIKRDVLEELSKHFTSEQIAEILHVSATTIRNYKHQWGIKGVKRRKRA